MHFPDITLSTLLGQAVGDAFGSPFEFHASSAELAAQSLTAKRYLTGLDCNLPRRRCRTPGLYTDDTQQALILLWIWAQMVGKGKDPLNATIVGELFMRVCTRMAKEPVPQRSHSFGVHRGTGKNFREAVLTGVPPNTAGLGGAMRIGPVATLLPDPATLIPWVIQVTAFTTSSAVAQAGAAIFALRVWFESRKEEPIYSLGILRQDTIGVEIREAWALLLEGYQVITSQGEAALLAFARQAGGSNRDLQCVADGYALTGIPWVLWCADQGLDFSDTLLKVCSVGGDTDTVGAMVGCIVAKRNIPLWMKNSLVGRGHVENPNLWHPIDSEVQNAHLDSVLCDRP